MTTFCQGVRQVNAARLKLGFAVRSSILDSIACLAKQCKRKLVSFGSNSMPNSWRCLFVKFQPGHNGTVMAFHPRGEAANASVKALSLTHGQKQGLTTRKSANSVP